MYSGVFYERYRITPAQAGKSTWSPNFRDLRQDHPRVGGEKYSFFTSRAHVRGSPPHGRGKVCLGCGPALLTGITPAWAGKRGFVSNMRQDCQDHPRVGGEKMILCIYPASSQGSPPRGRGKEVSHCGIERGNRITPAWAGKRNLCTGKRKRRGGDHPRVGGEKYSVSYDIAVDIGSPPRRRGKVSNGFC